LLELVSPEGHVQTGCTRNPGTCHHRRVEASNRWWGQFGGGYGLNAPAELRTNSNNSQHGVAGVNALFQLTALRFTKENYR